MNVTDAGYKPQSRNPIITSGSLAGLLALLSIFYLLDSFIVIQMAMTDAPPLAGWQADYRSVIYASFSILAFAAYVYMYFAHRQAMVHRVIWVVLGLYSVYSLASLIAQVSEIQRGFFIFVSLAFILSHTTFCIWGFILATREANNEWQPANVPANKAERVLQRYLRPGLTSPGVALVLALHTFPNVLLVSSGFFYGSPMSLDAGESVLKFLSFTGSILFMLTCLIIYASRQNTASFQRYGWLAGILFSLFLFFPQVAEARHFGPYFFNQALFPYIILFLAIRGYCLVYVEEILRERPNDEPSEDEYGSLLNKFYYNTPPGTLTSSRWGGIAAVLFIPVLYSMLMDLSPIFRQGDMEDMLFLLFIVPFFIAAAGYMRIYHSPATPWRHKGWWWYSFALNGILCILSLGSLTTPEPQYTFIIITPFLAIISFLGLNRLALDDPYERRLP
jgi:hypothetical protein